MQFSERGGVVAPASAVGRTLQAAGQKDKVQELNSNAAVPSWKPESPSEQAEAPKKPGAKQQAEAPM